MIILLIYQEPVIERVDKFIEMMQEIINRLNKRTNVPADREVINEESQNIVNQIQQGDQIEEIVIEGDISKDKSIQKQIEIWNKNLKK